MRRTVRRAAKHLVRIQAPARGRLAVVDLPTAHARTGHRALRARPVPATARAAAFALPFALCEFAIQTRCSPQRSYGEKSSNFEKRIRCPAAEAANR